MLTISSDLGLRNRLVSVDSWTVLFPRNLLRIRSREVTFARRGFPVGDGKRQARLEAIGEAFLRGYHAALDADRGAILAETLSRVDALLRGFAFEGAAMGLALMDGLSLHNTTHWSRFHDQAGDRYTYMLHVGYGWAAARLPWLRQQLRRRPEHLNRLYWWLVFDGIGFHQGYFHWRRSLMQERAHRRFAGYASHAFDQGLGRSLWFIGGGDVRTVNSLVERFERQRQVDLWSGIGLACAYAGGADDDEFRRLRNAAGDDCWQLAQGVTFAAEARALAGNPAEWTERACQNICGMSAKSAAELTWTTRENLPADVPGQPAYNVWRKRISEHLQQSEATCRI